MSNVVCNPHVHFRCYNLEQFTRQQELLNNIININIELIHCVNVAMCLFSRKHQKHHGQQEVHDRKHKGIDSMHHRL